MLLRCPSARSILPSCPRAPACRGPRSGILAASAAEPRLTVAPTLNAAEMTAIQVRGAPGNACQIALNTLVANADPRDHWGLLDTAFPMQEYIDKHGLQGKVEAALNACVQAKPSDPMAFMVSKWARSVQYGDRIRLEPTSWGRSPRRRRRRATWTAASWPSAARSTALLRALGPAARQRRLGLGPAENRTKFAAPALHAAVRRTAVGTLP